MTKFKFTTEQYVAYILSKLEPAKSNRIRLMKVAFFVEFAYKAKYGKELSESKYAAINMGPVIDGYKIILDQMKSEGLITFSGYNVLLTRAPKNNLPDEVACFIDPLIEKYSKLSDQELITLSHQTDSYKITTDNETRMGGIIDKDLAALESFFEDDNDQIDESELQPVDKNKLKKYEL